MTQKEIVDAIAKEWLKQGVSDERIEEWLDAQQESLRAEEESTKLPLTNELTIPT